MDRGRKGHGGSEVERERERGHEGDGQVDTIHLELYTMYWSSVFITRQSWF